MTKEHEAELNEYLQCLETDGFVTIESENGFIQSCKNPEGGYIIEYQDSANNHYRAQIENYTADEIKDFFRLYLSDSKNGQWKDDIKWIFFKNYTPEPSQPGIITQMLKSFLQIFRK